MQQLGPVSARNAKNGNTHTRKVYRFFIKLLAIHLCKHLSIIVFIFQEIKFICPLEMHHGSWRRMLLGNCYRYTSTVTLLNVPVKKVVVTVHSQGK